MTLLPDACFAHSRLAATYDIFEGERERATTWCAVTEVSPPFVSFRSVTVFDVDEVRDDADRPGREWVDVARRR